MALVASSVLVSVEYMYAPVEGLFRYREVHGSHVRPRGRSERPRGPDLSTLLFLVSPSGLRFLTYRVAMFWLWYRYFHGAYRSLSLSFSYVPLGHLLVLGRNSVELC